MTKPDKLSQLDAKLLKAHQKNDSADLVKLYCEAAEQVYSKNDVNAACFYYTHAFVFALESGNKKAAMIQDILVKHGREAPR